MSIQFLSLCFAPTKRGSLSASLTFWSVKVLHSRKENQGVCVGGGVHGCHFLIHIFMEMGVNDLYTQ